MTVPGHIAILSDHTEIKHRPEIPGDTCIVVTCSGRNGRIVVIVVQKVIDISEYTPVPACSIVGIGRRRHQTWNIVSGYIARQIISGGDGGGGRYLIYIKGVYIQCHVIGILKNLVGSQTCKRLLVEELFTTLQAHYSDQ